MFVPCFVVVLVMGRESWLLYFVFLVTCDCYYVALPHSAVGSV